jgi:ABC-type branched-subunit amino acid transport system substrate-binding protein
MSGAHFHHIRNLLTVAFCLTILLLSAFTISIGYVSSPSVQALLEHLPLTISETLSSILVADEGVVEKRTDIQSARSAAPAYPTSPYGLVNTGSWGLRTGTDRASSVVNDPVPASAISSRLSSPPQVGLRFGVESSVLGAATGDSGTKIVAAESERIEPSLTQVAPNATKPAVRGVTEKELRFGIAAPFSGSAKELGRQMKIGIEIAFNLANDLGGINGRQVKLFSADDGYEPSRTGEAMNQLWDTDAIFGIVGNVGTPTAAVALPFALDHRILFFGAFTGANLLRQVPPDHYVFNYRASYAEETEAAVRYLVRVRGLQPNEVAVFAQQDAYGDAGYEGVAKAVRALRGGYTEPIIRLNYKRNTVDVADAIAQLRLHKSIKAVVMIATYRAAANFIVKTRDRYPKMIYTNVSFVGSTALSEELLLQGERFADGVIVTQVVPAVSGYSRAVLDYKAALAKYFPGEAADYVSFEGYIVGKILVEGLRRVGPQVDTEKLIDALESIHDLDMGLGTLLNFGPSEHQASHKVWGTQMDKTGHFNAIDLE